MSELSCKLKDLHWKVGCFSGKGFSIGFSFPWKNNTPFFPSGKSFWNRLFPEIFHGKRGVFFHHFHGKLMENRWKIWGNTRNIWGITGIYGKILGKSGKYKGKIWRKYWENMGSIKKIWRKQCPNPHIKCKENMGEDWKNTEEI